MDPHLALDYAARIEADLRENILPFWLQHAVDGATGKFIGAMTNDLAVDLTAERGALLACRVLWTFSAAYRKYSMPEYRDMADRAYADLTGNFLDRVHGGFFWSIDAHGHVLRDRKQVYGQAFAIYALAEYHRATAETEPHDLAVEIFHLLEQHARDPQHGGYFEAFSRDWQPIADMRLSNVDQNDPKSQNTHLHVMEAYTSLMRVWRQPAVSEAQTALVHVMLNRIVHPQTHHLGLFFGEDWTPRSEKISYGHDIEAAWLLTQAAEALHDPELIARTGSLAVKIADVTLAEGVDADGGVFNDGNPRGVMDTNKEWWPQAEAVVGFLDAYRISGDERHFSAALRTWDFIDRRLIDHERGEWLRGVTRDGSVLADQLKIGFWKCPYHNGRTGLEAVSRLRNLAQRPTA